MVRPGSGLVSSDRGDSGDSGGEGNGAVGGGFGEAQIHLRRVGMNGDVVQ